MKITAGWRQRTLKDAFMERGLPEDKMEDVSRFLMKEDDLRMLL